MSAPAPRPAIVHRFLSTTTELHHHGAWHVNVDLSISATTPRVAVQLWRPLESTGPTYLTPDEALTYAGTIRNAAYEAAQAATRYGAALGVDAA